MRNSTALRDKLAATHCNSHHRLITPEAHHLHPSVQALALTRLFPYSDWLHLKTFPPPRHSARPNSKKRLKRAFHGSAVVPDCVSNIYWETEHSPSSLRSPASECRSILSSTCCRLQPPHIAVLASAFPLCQWSTVIQSSRHATLSIPEWHHISAYTAVILHTLLSIRPAD